MLPRPCLVTTLRNSDEVIESFIEHHLAIGFQHLYLFFDNPEEPSRLRLKSTDKISIIRNDKKLQNLWRDNSSYEANKEFIYSEVMARQILNCELAIRLALHAGYSWIAHIDIDELFITENNCDVRVHFKSMEDEGYNNILYYNDEGIPESFGIRNYFKEVTLFRRNIKKLTGSQKEEIKRIYGKDIRYFRFYQNGKSAAKLQPGLLPSGVHSFKGKPAPCPDGTKILHYPCCGYEHFKRKYKTLGDFPDKWFNKEEISALLPSHTLSRNVVLSGDELLTKRFYRLIFMENNQEQIERLINENIYVRQCGIKTNHAYSDSKSELLPLSQ